MAPAPISPEIRFWRYVSPCPMSGCWHWTGGITPFGHGRFRLGRLEGQIGPHVFSYAMHVAPVPEGVCVLHHCDNPGCVNPGHLFLGDRGDNARDAAAKGRLKHNFAPGWNPARGTGRTRKITEADVIAIRQDDRPATEIAKAYGLCASSVWKIRSRRKWRHV